MNILKSNHHKTKGSILIEALISVTIVGIGALGLINLQSYLIQSKSNAYQNSEAMEIATAKIEELRNYSTITQYNAIGSGNDVYYGVNSNYNRNWTVVNYTDPRYKIITMNVTWTRPNNSSANMQLTSDIGELNPILSGLAMEDSANRPPALTPP